MINFTTICAVQICSINENQEVEKKGFKISIWKFKILRDFSKDYFSDFPLLRAFYCRVFSRK